MARQMDGRTGDGYLWAGPHRPHASGRVHSLHGSSHVGVPCVREGVSREGQEEETDSGGRRSRSQPPHNLGSPPCPRLYLVAVWDPWNWAAVAESQELRLEAERHGRRELSGCSAGLGDRGGRTCLPQLPAQALGATHGAPETTPANGSPGGAVSSGRCYRKGQCGRSSAGEEPLRALLPSWVRIPARARSLWPHRLPHTPRRPHCSLPFTTQTLSFFGFMEMQLLPSPNPKLQGHQRSISQNPITTGSPFYFILLFRAVPAVYGGSQAKGRIRATAASLLRSHSNTGSLTHWVRPGIEPATSWFLVRFTSTAPQRELQEVLFKGEQGTDQGASEI